jgi:hypothetical protein
LRTGRSALRSRDRVLRRVYDRQRLHPRSTQAVLRRRRLRRVFDGSVLRRGAAVRCSDVLIKEHLRSIWKHEHQVGR